ncbi:MAG: Lrp/AsnC family transcriptional regulator [Candidatus Bathyarchaeota archaeon]|nr:Lrp/AsnC family transcriptional regulator [Candidatus Bathyarchaeota archaeon]
MDDYDRKIIQMLEQNSRQSFNEVAKKLKLSESAIRKRVVALQEKGIIKKFTVQVDPAKFGVNSVSIVGIDVEPTKLLEVAQKLCEVKEIKSVATSTGDHMIMTEIWTKDGRELTKLLSEKIGAIDGVKKICPAIVLEKFKE